VCLAEHAAFGGVRGEVESSDYVACGHACLL
jgi:hypothetical protein